MPAHPVSWLIEQQLQHIVVHVVPIFTNINLYSSKYSRLAAMPMDSVREFV